MGWGGKERFSLAVLYNCFPRNLFVCFYYSNYYFRLLTVPLVFQVGVEDKLTNFGHPRVLKIPNCVKYSRLLNLIQGLVPGEEGNLVLVDESGEKCSRCEHGNRCRGCSVSSLVDAGDINLKPGDKLALRIRAAEKNLLGN